MPVGGISLRDRWSTAASRRMAALKTPDGLSAARVGSSLCLSEPGEAIVSNQGGIHFVALKDSSTMLIIVAVCNSLVSVDPPVAGEGIGEVIVGLSLFSPICGLHGLIVSCNSLVVVDRCVEKRRKYDNVVELDVHLVCGGSNASNFLEDKRRCRLPVFLRSLSKLSAVLGRLLILARQLANSTLNQLEELDSTQHLPFTSTSTPTSTSTSTSAPISTGRTPSPSPSPSL